LGVQLYSRVDHSNLVREIKSKVPTDLIVYMSLLTLTDGSRVFQLNKQESIQLELKLNKTIYGRKWITIGDHLFNFGSGRPCEVQSILNQEQYDFLYDLCYKKSSK